MAPPPKTPEEVEASNLFASYQRGWRTSAKGRRPDVLFTEHRNPELAKAYQKGFDDQQVIAHAAFEKAAKDYGYELFGTGAEILR